MPALTPARTVAGASTLASVSSAIVAAHCASIGASPAAASRMAIRMASSARPAAADALCSSLLDDPAGHAGTGIAGRLADVVVRCRVHDHRTVQRIVESTTAQYRTIGVHIDLGHALGVGD